MARPILRLTNFLHGVRRLQHAPMEPALAKRIALKYAVFIRKRFLTYSRGGGDWAPLKPATVARRAKKKTRRGAASTLKVNAKKTGGPAAILRHTDTLYKSLALGGPGNVLRVEPSALWFGVGGMAHPGGEELAVIARAHQEGNPRSNVPARPFLVPPDEPLRAVLREMVRRHGLRKMSAR